MHLVVTHAFAGYARGDAITDAAAIDAALAEHLNHVVAVASTVLPPLALPTAAPPEPWPAPPEPSPETAPEAKE